MKTAVVTGASRGIGAAIAADLRQNDYKVIGTSVSGRENENADEMVALDLKDRASIKNAIEQIKQLSKNSIDVLINNAAVVGKRGSIVDDIKDVLELMQVNLLGLMEITAGLLPSMSENSAILNLSSGAGDVESVESFNYGAYNISKAAIDFYSRSLAKMVEGRGVKVIAVDPEWVATDMGGSGAPKKPEAVAHEVIKMLSDYDRLVSGAKYLRGLPKN